MYRVRVTDPDGVIFQFENLVFSLGETEAVLEAAESEYLADDGYYVCVENLTPDGEIPDSHVWVEVD